MSEICQKNLSKFLFKNSSKRSHQKTSSNKIYQMNFEKKSSKKKVNKFVKRFVKKMCQKSKNDIGHNIHQGTSKHVKVHFWWDNLGSWTLHLSRKWTVILKKIVFNFLCVGWHQEAHGNLFNLFSQYMTQNIKIWPKIFIKNY